MAEEFKIVHSRLAPKISIASKSAPEVAAAQVAAAFKAKAVASTSGMDLFSVREAMTRLLASNGGRPGITGVTAQVKIPRIEVDWIKLEKIAMAAGSLRRRPSITQTAALILHTALSKISEEELEEAVREAFASDEELLRPAG